MKRPTRTNKATHSQPLRNQGVFDSTITSPKTMYSIKNPPANQGTRLHFLGDGGFLIDLAIDAGVALA